MQTPALAARDPESKPGAFALLENNPLPGSGRRPSFCAERLSGFIQIPGVWIPSRGLALSRTEDKWSQTPRLPTPVQAPGQSTTLLTWWGGEVGGGRLFLHPAALHQPPATSRVQGSRDFAQSSSSVGGWSVPCRGAADTGRPAQGALGAWGARGRGLFSFFLI